MLVGARELVKERGFPAVLVADECELQPRFNGCRVFLFVVRLKALAFAVSRVWRVAKARCRRRRMRFFVSRILDFDARGIIQSQRQFVPVQSQFHRVTHGSKFHQGDFGTGDQAHVQKVLTQGAVTAHTGDDRGLADGKFAQKHGKKGAKN